MTSAKKLARKRAAKQKHEELQRIRRHKCSVEGCIQRAVAEYVCIVCEHLAESKPDKETFVTYGCTKHNEWAMHTTRRHALKKHPINLLRAVAAGLAGEEVF